MDWETARKKYELGANCDSQGSETNLLKCGSYGDGRCLECYENNKAMHNRDIVKYKQVCTEKCELVKEDFPTIKAICERDYDDDCELCKKELYRLTYRKPIKEIVKMARQRKLNKK